MWEKSFVWRGNYGSVQMVVIEGIKALCELHTDQDRSMELAFEVLSGLILSSKSIVKYAGLKALNRIAMINPSLVATLEEEIEDMIGNVNKSVASMAISIMLKICKEKEVEPLLISILEYMPETGDEFRIDTIRAVKHLVNRYPRTTKVLIQFLIKCLRLFSTMEFRREIIDCTLHIITLIPAMRDEALMVLVDLIEDCQYENLTSRGLEILANEIPRSSKGEKYIRFICNRLVLESEKVRASAITALATLAYAKPSFREIIKVILRKDYI